MKLTGDLDFVWVKAFGGSGAEFENGASVQADANDNILVTGRFEGTTDFDRENSFGGNPDIITANGTGDAFLAKYDANGQFSWVRSMGSGGANFEIAADVEVAANGNVSVLGWFQGANFNPGGGAPFNSFGNFDVFVTQFNQAGTFQWSRQIGGAGNDRGRSLTSDSNSDLFLVGFFNNTVDFDPTGSGTILGHGHGGGTTRAGDGFLWKLEDDGDFQSVGTMGSTGEDSFQAITSDSANNLYLTGFFSGTVTFDTSEGPVSLTSAGGTDLFAYKLTSRFSSLSGTVFDDQNGDGVLVFGEPRLQGWTVFLDRNGNGVVDAGDVSTLSDANGDYRFAGLTHNVYRIGEVVMNGWVPTLPTTGFWSLPVPGGTELTDIDFGNQQIPILGADLVATEFLADPDHVLMGNTKITVSFSNIGTVDSGPFFFHIVFSPDSIIGNIDDQVVPNTTFVAPGIPAGNTITATNLQVRLDQFLLYNLASAADAPDQPPGTVSQDIGTIGVIVDINNDVFETEETNNFNRGFGLDTDDITYFPWDIDGNGVVQESDALAVLQSLGTGDPLTDLNGDGLVTPLEALDVIRRVGYLVNPTVFEPDPPVIASGFFARSAFSQRTLVGEQVLEATTIEPVSRNEMRRKISAKNVVPEEKNPAITKIRVKTVSKIASTEEELPLENELAWEGAVDAVFSSRDLSSRTRQGRN